MSAAVVGVSKAAVLERTTRARGNSLDELPRPVGRLVVDDDDVELDLAGMVEDGAEARLEPVRLVRRDDDDGEVVHVCGGHRASPRETSSCRRGVDAVDGLLIGEPLDELAPCHPRA